MTAEKNDELVRIINIEKSIQDVLVVSIATIKVIG